MAAITAYGFTAFTNPIEANHSLPFSTEGPVELNARMRATGTACLGVDPVGNERFIISFVKDFQRYYVAAFRTQEEANRATVWPEQFGGRQDAAHWGLEDALKEL